MKHLTHKTEEAKGGWIDVIESKFNLMGKMDQMQTFVYPNTSKNGVQP